MLAANFASAAVRKSYLINEHQKALAETVTPDCRQGYCSICGVCQDLAAKVDLKGGDDGANQNNVT